MEEATFTNYITSPNFRSVKSEAVDPRITVVGLDPAEELAQINLSEPQDPRLTVDEHKTVKTKQPSSLLWMTGAVVIVVGITVASVHIDFDTLLLSNIF